MTDFGSLLTASITPFDSRGVLNTDTLWRLCRKLVHDKSEGLVLTGTTGESPNLSIKDREIIYSTAIDSVSDKQRLLLVLVHIQLLNQLKLLRWQILLV